jgi:hypothetical protein
MYVRPPVIPTNILAASRAGLPFCGRAPSAASPDAADAVRLQPSIAMNESDYLKILEHLDAASRVLTAHRGTLLEADVRIRHLLSITGSETRRELGEARRRLRQAGVSAAVVHP